MIQFKNKLLNIKMPHTYVILGIILLSVIALAYIIPSGEFDRVLDESSEKMIIIPDSFHYAEGIKPHFFDIFLTLQKGYVSAAGIMFLMIFAYGYVYLLIDNGTLNSVINILIKALGKKTYLIIPVSMLIFGVLGSTMGIYEEVYGMVPVFIGIVTALGYDAVVGGAIVFVGVATGFAAATTNPFSVGIAQSIAGISMYSGIEYRILIFIVFEVTVILYLLQYARRVKKDPKKSILYGEERTLIFPFKQKEAVITVRQKICLMLFVFTIAMLLYGTTKLGWYINEIAAMYLMMMIITGITSGYSTDKICKTFIKSTQSMVGSMMVVGFTRGIVLVMQNAKISDTIVYYLSSILYGRTKYISAIGMLFIQNIINFFITGSSSQAAITMPIMTPVADIIHLSRQTAVLVYQFGDGFSNMFWPTACAVECGLMGIPINKWYKFMAPLFLIMVVLQIIFAALSVLVYV